MRQYTKLYLILFLFFALFESGCASKGIRLASNPPGSKIFKSTNFSTQFEELGTTPAKLNLKKLAGPNGFAYITMEKEGYQKYRVVLPAQYSQGSLEVKLEKNLKETDQELRVEIEKKLRDQFKTQIDLLRDEVDRQKEENVRIQTAILKEAEDKYGEKTSIIFKKVIEIQNALQIKKIAKAGKAIAELRAMEPPEELLLTLEGNFEFITGKVDRALASYERALKIDPSNVELAGILAELRKVRR